MLKKFTFKAVLIVLMSSSLYADSFKISTNFLQMDYIERDRNNNFLDSEKSDFNDMAGLELEYILDFTTGHGGANDSSLEFNFVYFQGKSLYDGFLQPSGVPFKTTSDMTIYEPRIRWSEISKNEAYDISVFASIGYRYWIREIGSQYGYREDYKWAYMDVGMKILFHDDLYKNWHLGIEVSYQRAYKPTMYAYLNGGLDFNLGTTSGYNIDVPLLYDINKNLSLELSYEYDNWNIDASNIVAGYYEPDSKTKNKIIKIALITRW